jgi:hypothetical protein
MVDTVLVITGRLAIVSDRDRRKDNDESAENDCTAYPETITVVAIWASRADCQGEDEKTISEGENRP